MNTDRYNQVIARADRVMKALDERDGPVRAAARRERQRLNADFKRRAARVGVWIGAISLATIVVGLIMPIGVTRPMPIVARLTIPTPIPARTRARPRPALSRCRSRRAASRTAPSRSSRRAKTAFA